MRLPHSVVNVASGSGEQYWCLVTDSDLGPRAHSIDMESSQRVRLLWSEDITHVCTHTHTGLAYEKRVFRDLCVCSDFPRAEMEKH